jgi:threonine aldolase
MVPSNASQVVDLRSDTVTKPTPEMRRAMAEAEVGDDVFMEDPTVARLEALAAERLGKEAGLFVTSGTQGNQVSLVAHTQRGEEIILDENCHIFNYEVAALAVLSAVQARGLRGRHGILDPAEVREAIRPPNIHHPKDSLICLESTHNRGGGSIYPIETLREIRRIAKEHGLAIHLDGARLFNACVASGVAAREVAAQADSVTFCLSKGLGAPVGSVVVGSQAFIDRARRARKMLGGGMRQAGIIAAAGIVALETMVDRLREDHENARLLADGLVQLPGIKIDPALVQTNIVIFGLGRKDLDAAGLVLKLAGQGVKCLDAGSNRIRMVTHKDVDRAGILHTLEVARTILK